MNTRLDPMTIQRLAQVIVDIEGPFERHGSQLAALLERAAWPSALDYDGSPRIPWLIEVLNDARDDHAAVARLICRVCDPKEYDDGMDSAEALRTEVNRILASEGLAVGYVSGRPVLGELADDGQSTVYAIPDDLEARIRPLVSSEETLSWLMTRIEETRICERNGAYAFALIGIGSFTEGLLLDVLTHRDPALASRGFPVRNGFMPAKNVSFATLLSTARERKWIQLDAHDFMEIVRGYRNFVHLRLQQERGVAPDRDTVMMCWGPVLAVLNDLESSKPG